MKTVIQIFTDFVCPAERYDFSFFNDPKKRHLHRIRDFANFV
ncbi:hypothetical protein CGLO_14129 [Colletotrichum gloeosporioides Cg-14]|uniref:Uncharacterized protein n=1 Tax=Colletotrichum gloeosporioides (strain Cg-14) TaxID=1237896 RepID=T0LEI1_COLGC|nr:hypothetical protein CGLO_14129 [Colletotrichum gloeosporioides Cg-14]